MPNDLPDASLGGPDNPVAASARSGITLVLGGGGARGLAHIGVLQVLERERIPVAAIAGASMGGLLGAYFAAGIPLEEVEAGIVRLGRPREWIKLLDLRWSASGLSLKGMRLYELLAQRLGGLRFADLRIPLAVVAVDLRSGSRGGSAGRLSAGRHARYHFDTLGFSSSAAR